MDNVLFLNNNFSDEITQNKILKIFNDKIDVIISDMAENTTGNKTVDSIRTNQSNSHSDSNARYSSSAMISA